MLASLLCSLNLLLLDLLFSVDPPEHKLKSGPASTGHWFCLINILNKLLNHQKVCIINLL